MEIKQINIGTDINLEKLLDTRLLIQAGSGGGKSYAVRKTIESVGNRVQQIIIDPEGEFVTLREKFDFVLIGKDGDIPLSLKYAETLAHKLLETNLSAIIDLYELKHHERILFVKRFLDALINAPKELWHSCLVYVDEAHLFCPEGGKSESASSVIDLCTRGRKRGFAAVLATQRLSKLSKDAAAECLNKMIGQTGLDNDRKRAAEELGLYDKASILNLRNLEPGEFYTFGPAISREVIKFKVSPVVTTHLQSGKRMIANPPTPNAVKKILNKLADIPQEAEKELINKQQLQAEVIRLRSEVTKLTNNTSPGKSNDIEIGRLKLQVTNLQDVNEAQAGIIKTKEKNTVLLLGIIAEFKEGIKKQQTIIDGLKSIEVKLTTDDFISKGTDHKAISPNKTQKGYSGNDKPLYVKPAIPATTKSSVLAYGERRILTACAQFPEGLKRDALTVLTGYKRSSRDTYIQRLKMADLLFQQGERLLPTERGVAELGPDFEPLPTGSDLQQYWLTNLPKGESAILAILVEVYPKSVERNYLTERTGYLRSSRDTYLQRMVSKEIVVVTGYGQVGASDNLFD